MCTPNLGLCILAIFSLALGAGCKKTDSGATETPAPSPKSAQNDPLATLHWIGAKQLANDKNAGEFLKIWRLPESEKLRVQTLDKLALAPWRVSATNGATASTNYAALMRQNPSAAMLRPLLDDLVQEEWYLELREPKQKEPQLTLAIKLDAARAAVWDTNLASVFAGLSQGPPAAISTNGTGSGWQIATTNANAVALLARRVEFSHAGEWTLIGFGTAPTPQTSELLARISRVSTANSVSNAWVEGTFDLRRISEAFSQGWNLPAGWPTISLAANGDGQNVITRGELNFPKALPPIEAWNIPTNLIHEPLHSFTAIQGLSPWLSSLPWWQNLHVSTPKQLFCWAQSASPFLDYAAAPLPDASSVMTKLGPAIMDSLNPLLTTNRMGKWQRATNSDGVTWSAPVMNPFVQSVSSPEGNYLLAGLAPFGLTNSPMPVGTFHDLLSRTNVMYFDREVTAPRIEAWLYIGQLFRIVLRRAQLPPGCVSIAWLRASGQLLRESTTAFTKTGPNQLSAFRSSTLGLAAPELHAVVDWLESPEFPARPHTMVAKLRPVPTGSSH